MSTQQNKFQSNVSICSIYFCAATLNINDSHGLTIFSGVWFQPMHSNGEVGDEEELDFYLESTNDISWDDDNMLSDRNPSSEVKTCPVKY